MEPLSSVQSQRAATTILIADDHVLFNDGIKLLLSSAFSNIHQVFSGTQVLTVMPTVQPGLILMDINLPGIDGLELSSRLKRMADAPKIILLTMYSDQKFIKLAEESGVEGYLLKSATQEELLSGIYTVLHGGKVYEVGSKAKDIHAGDIFMEKFKLTKRELQIIQLIKEGMSNTLIADKMFLSVFTVETHRRNINLKLNIKSPAELVRKAIEMGL